ncbi:hypothetical protein [Streptomyces sp. CL12]|uniref:hypothetical protein n=1 Tax=Streptomyces sp. CL12 TaxID=3391744 RepID=UPI003A809170
MPDSYPSIGEAIGAAMQHNIRLAYGDRENADWPLQVRRLPDPKANPHSLPGMVVRLTETAPPDEVAGILEEVTSALVGALPQLTELVAAAADWTRARLDFSTPDSNSTFETWTRLAAAHGMLLDAQEQLEVAGDGILECPAERVAPQSHEMVNPLRTGDLLHDVLGRGPDGGPAASTIEVPQSTRERAARSSSPRAAARRPAPAAEVPRPPAGPAPSRPPRVR